MSKPTSEKSDSWLIKSGLIAGGLLLALLISFPIVYYFVLRDDGTRYSSPDALRAAIARPASSDATSAQPTMRAFIQTNPNDAIMFELRPGAESMFKGAHVKINSLGMRAPETTIEKPAGVYRVALLGDSFAFGWGVEEPDSFARVIERELNRQRPNGPRVEVLNFGVPGYSTFQETAAFFEKGVKFKPDAVLVFVVDNDFGLPFFMGVAEESGSKLITAFEYARRHWNSEEPRDAAKRRFLQSIMDPNGRLQELATRGRELGYKTFVAVNPGRTWERESKKLWVLRDPKSGITEINIRPGLLETIQREKIDLKDLVLPDDPHPSALKHRIMGELLAKALDGEVPR